MTQPTESALPEQGIHIGKASTRQDLGVGYSVIPEYTQDTANTSQVEGVESFIPSPCVNAVQQCADDTGLNHTPVYLRREA